MWRSACCLLIALLLAIIGVSIDILVSKEGVTLLSKIDITLEYGWKSVSWTVDTEHYNSTRSIVYSDAYNEYCVNNTYTFCTDLKNVRDAGRVYIAFNIVGILLLSITISLTILVSLGRCLCDCRCRLNWIISILCMISVLCFLIAFSVFLSDFSDNLDSLFEELTPFKVVNWDATNIGASIGCLITAVCVGFISLFFILWIDRRYIEFRRGQYDPMLLGPMGPPPPGFGPPPYGMPPPGPPPQGYMGPPGNYYQVQYGSNLTPV